MGGRRGKVTIRNGLYLFLAVEWIVICLIASFRLINIESTITLLIFNFLFATLIFQLSGSTNRKVGLLSAGNFVGLFWNFVFFHFSLAGTAIFGKTFDAFYIIIYPVLNLMWVVPYWSISLAFLSKPGSHFAEAN